MFTSFTCPCCTLSMNSVKVIVVSLRPCPVRTTANRSTATQIRTTQKTAVLILEFTIPPYQPIHLYRRSAVQARFSIRGLSKPPCNRVRPQTRQPGQSVVTTQWQTHRLRRANYVAPTEESD